jgi:DMSO reductase anchor subunit
MLLLNSGKDGATVLLAISLLSGMAQVLIIYEEVLFYRHLNRDDKLYYQLNRTRILLQAYFGKLKKIRLYSLIISALLLPILSTLFISSGLISLATTTLIVSIVGALTSELIGRYLFYRTVVPLGLAGNFFAGNQRG